MVGSLIFDCRQESKYEGITLTVSGTVNMQLSSKNIGIFDAFHNSVKVAVLWCKWLHVTVPSYHLLADHFDKL